MIGPLRRRLIGRFLFMAIPDWFIATIPLKIDVMVTNASKLSYLCIS